MAGRESFDVAVIGAGVIGCAVARRFTLEGARVVVIEKAPDILDGASKGNSAILHTGFDAPPGSVEQACVAAGYEEYLAIHERLGLPLIKSGALVLAWTDEEEQALPALMEQARANGVDNVALHGAHAIRDMEPNLSGRVRAGFSVPGEYIIDPWSAPHAYLLQAIANGAEVRRDCELLAGWREGTEWLLSTSRGAIGAGFVVNAAGLFGDKVDEILTGRRRFEIRPRKGQFVVYDKAAAALASRILLPVPSKTTKGIVVCRTAFGNLLVGPTAEEQEDRERADLCAQTLKALKSRGEQIIPALASVDVTAIYAGLRPATEFKDYQIQVHDGLGLITVGGIRSTGLTSALGTARHVFGLYQSVGKSHAPPPDPVWPSVTNISEVSERPWQAAGNGGIVCHCELVTRAEIDQAMTGPLAAQSLAGLKRRTRVTMGRCQGFYCTAELARMTKDRLLVPMTGGGNGC